MSDCVGGLVNDARGDRTILLDVDGILADFIRGTCKLYGWDHAALMADWPRDDPWDYYKRYRMTMGDFYGGIERAGAAFWEWLEQYPHARRFYDFCRGQCPTTFCTTPSPCPEGLAGKYRWLRRFTDRRELRDVVFTFDKAMLARPGVLLVDDSDANVARYRAAGGDAVLWPALWNARHAESDKAERIVREEIKVWVSK